MRLDARLEEAEKLHTHPVISSSAPTNTWTPQMYRNAGYIRKGGEWVRQERDHEADWEAFQKAEEEVK